MLRRVALAGVLLALPPILAAQSIQERVDLAVAQRIRDEALNRSQIP